MTIRLRPEARDSCGTWRIFYSTNAMSKEKAANIELADGPAELPKVNQENESASTQA